MVAGCQPAEDSQSEINPPAEGFNTSGSDPEAVAIADSVMAAMGGRKAWDELHYVKWNFFGHRDLIWDKQTGDVRIDVPEKNTTYLVNVNTMKGKVMMEGHEITDPDSLQNSLNEAKSIWINDSYWLFMPFKLKDSGVTLSYMGQDTMRDGANAEVLKLTFDKVGVTPNNKYMIYVDPEDHLVKQWAYFRDAAQDSASAIWPFDNYRQYDGLMLSANRSDNGGPRDVKVFDQMDQSVFTEFEPDTMPK